MCIIPTHIGDMCSLPIDRVSFPYIVINIVAAKIAVQEIVLRFCCVSVTPSWGTLWFMLFLPCRGRTNFSLSTITSISASGLSHSVCVVSSLSSLMLKILLPTLVTFIVASISAVWYSSASCPIFG